MSDHNHGHHGHDAPSVHYSVKDYTIGFVLAVILTVIPFWLVMGNVLDPSMTRGVIVLFAAVQFVVHMIYFLHMNTKSEGGWNFMSMALTLVLLVIILAGSVWVMHNMNTFMMPGMDGGDGPAVMHNMQDM